MGAARSESSVPHRSSMFSLAVILAMILAVCLAAFQEPAAADATAKELAELHDQLEAAYQKLEAEYRTLPRDSFEPSALLEKAGRDDAALLAHVARETWWIPYEGLLKGAAGVLADRAGNSLDRSLLVAELLEAAGYRVRLARAKLTEKEARALLARLAPPPKEALAGDCIPISDDLSKRAAAHAADLEAALASAISKPEDVSAERLAAARDHWWVERQLGDHWVALDPASPEKPLRAKAEQTFDFSKRQGGSKLPAGLHHEVDLLVMIEAWDEGKLVERPVLKATLRPADLIGQRVSLHHHPMSGKPALSEPGGEAIKKTALAEKEWLPVILAGDRRIAKASFDDAGAVHPNPNLAPASKVGSAARGIFDSLGGSVAGKEKDSPAKRSVLTAEWVEFKVRSPGRAPRVVRREVFDLIGPAARAAAAQARPELAEAQRLDRALTLGGSAEWLLLPCHVSWALARHAVSKLELDQRKTYLAILKEPDRAKRGALADSLDDLGPLFWVAAARRSLNPARGETAIHSPNILGFHVRYRMGGDGQIVARAILDMASCPVASRTGILNLAAVLRQGVADAAAEDIALENAKGSMDNVLDLLEAARSEGLKLVTLRGPGDHAAAALGLHPDAAERVAADLAAGYLVVIPEKPAAAGDSRRSGWWRVHPRTGETVAVMDTGYHSDTTEETIINDRTVLYLRPRQYVPTHKFWSQQAADIARQAGFGPGEEFIIPIIERFQLGLLRLGIF